MSFSKSIDMKKNLFSTVFLLAFVFSAFPANSKKASEYKLQNGIPVYVKVNNDSALSAVYLVQKGGIAYLTPETSGLESAVFTMLSMGSEKYSFQELKNFSYETQGGFNTYSINDGSVFGMSCISKYFDQTFDRFEDAFFNPLFAEKEYELLMNDYRQSVQNMMNDPESLLVYYMGMMIYQNHPYGAKTSVTPDSIQNITLSAITEYYRSMIDSRRISFVASGKIDVEKLLSQLNEKFGKIQEGSEPLKSNEIPAISVSGEPVVLVNENCSGAALIVRAFASPAVTSPDYVYARIASDIFSDIMHNVVREKNGICYTPVSEILSSSAPFGFEILLKATDLTGFSGPMEECRKIMLEGKTISAIDENGNYIFEPLENRLDGYVNSYITAKYSSQATVGGVASRMAASLLQFGNITQSDELTKIARDTTAQDVIAAFEKYWITESSRWFAVVGPDDEEKIHFE